MSSSFIGEDSWSSLRRRRTTPTMPAPTTTTDDNYVKKWTTTNAKWWPKLTWGFSGFYEFKQKRPIYKQDTQNTYLITGQHEPHIQFSDLRVYVEFPNNYLYLVNLSSCLRNAMNKHKRCYFGLYLWWQHIYHGGVLEHMGL